MYFVYMLRCRGGSLYTGIAADMEKRLRQHASGGAACAKYTRAHPPEALAALWQAEDHAAAARLEAFLKTLPPAKKRMLAAGEAAPEAPLHGRRAAPERAAGGTAQRRIKNAPTGRWGSFARLTSMMSGRNCGQI